ncbi:1,4-alpha-glucan branching protein GlgB [Ruminobacter sp.]|jgi:1,4-alpha-glucan branching enzyme|uniref:1,4-alpha-glucan branching protein GlgB n=1 Tax=Ruminobacter sp. TaxID=2774296 RepID=UPI0038670E5A
MLIDDLNNASLARPFETFGLQKNPEGQGGYILRTWLPGAISVDVKSIDGKKKLGSMAKVEEDGLFELNFPKADKEFNYLFDVEYQDSKIQVIDPYQFRNEAYEGLSTMRNDAANLYRTMGAQLVEIEVEGVKIKGVRFAVYAPSASNVSVIGDFNFWDGRRHPMQRSLMGEWVLFVPGLGEGERYKYELKDPFGNRLPHKSDPVGFYAEQYPSFASVVYDQNRYKWNDAAWIESQKNDKLKQAISIYELHFASWRRHENGDSLSYREMAEQLIPYVKEMGYTHIELLPIMEHPFSGSWGYQPVGLFSPTSRFGTADDFKYFIDQCHQNGIGVILDWVPAHFPSDSHGLARFDGTPLYEYEDPRRGWHPDWNSYIYDFGRDTVRQFLVASALVWLDYYHVDGLRVDAVASMLYWDYSRKAGEWVPNVDGGNHNYEAISLLRWFNEEVYKNYPQCMTIAEESTAFAGVSRPTYTGGLGFGFKWNMGWMHDTLEYMKKDPIYRKYHHSEMTFSMIYAYDENFILSISHDEVVHGKLSMLYKMPGDEWQQAANLRAYMGYMYAHPGKKLNFMGTEFAQTAEWNHDSQLQWWLLQFDKHKGQKKLIQDLNAMYKSEPALYNADYDKSGFMWLDHSDYQNSIFAMMRRDANGENPVIVVSNFTPTTHEQYRLGVPTAGKYKVILNTDSKYYWGSDYDLGGIEFEASDVSWHGQYHSIVLNLPPLATVFIKRIGD